MAKPIVRLRVIQAGFALGMLAVLVRIIQVQLVHGARYARDAQNQRTERVELPARRGTIYDRRGVPLASTQERFHVGIAPNELRNPARDAREIATRLGIPRREVEGQLRRRYLYFHGPFSSASVQPLRAIHGVHLTPELIRFYPDPRMARSLLGRPAADGRAADGLERVLDTLLAGRPGRAVVLRDGRGRRYESPSRLDAFPVPGPDVYLTIDADLQDIVERALADAIRQYDAASGDVVVLDPRSGEVLAVASREPDGTASSSAFTSTFEPGSTAKLFAAAALLRHGRVSRSDSVYGEEGVYRVSGRTITDDHPEHYLTLHSAIAHSSNIGMVKFSSRLSPEELYQGLRSFGLGNYTGVEFPSESRGILPPPHQWSGVTGSSLPIGYEVSITPIQLAQAYAAIANDGVLLRPTLVREVRAADGTTIYRSRPEPVRRVVSPEVAAQLREMLRGVVDTGGTGSTAGLATFAVAGKTGTARRAGPGGYVSGQYTASFVSLFPADDPQLVMVVKLQDPRGAYARVTAAPVTRTVLQQLLGARSSTLDRSRLSTAPAPPDAPRLDDGMVPQVVSWPPSERPVERRPVPVPDVRGLSLRAAARRLHAEGLQVQVRGWGRVVSVNPAPGARVNPGSTVRVTAQEGDQR